MLSSLIKALILSLLQLNHSANIWGEEALIQHELWYPSTLHGYLQKIKLAENVVCAITVVLKKGCTPTHVIFFGILYPVIIIISLQKC